MWEAYDLKNDDLLWASIPFMGGIAGKQQAPCGVISSAVVCLSFRYRCSLLEKEKAKKARHRIRKLSGDLVDSFEAAFGSIVCRDLVGLNLSNPIEYSQFSKSKTWRERCNKAVTFTIDKLYEFEEMND
jgi:C_GCAxxG_C_C family probable redox protein